jgi:hypothetical protein
VSKANRPEPTPRAETKGHADNGNDKRKDHH